MLSIAKIDLSVIIPIYNPKEEYLEECLNSITIPKLDNIEFILILDGCNKITKEICYKYKKQDSRIVVYEQENKGEGASRNKGIKLAEGKWITFIDADDWIDNGYLKTIYEKASKEESDIIIFDCYVEYKNKKVKNIFYTKNGVLDKEDIEEIQLQNIGKGEAKYFPNDCNISVVWAKLYRKDFILDNNLKFIEGIKRMPDTLFNMYAFEKAKNIKHYNRYGYHYRKNNNSITQNYDKNLEKDINIFLNEVNRYINEFKKEKRFINTYYIAVLTKLIQIYEIYINNKKTEELKQFIKDKHYMEYINVFDNIPKDKINLYQKLMLTSIKNRNIFKAKILIKIKKMVKDVKNEKIQ